MTVLEQCSDTQPLHLAQTAMLYFRTAQHCALAQLPALQLLSAAWQLHRQIIYQ
jgi:hypothetical protein